MLDRLIPLAILVLFFLNAGIGALAFNNSAELREQEQGADYRICERAERTKANVHRGYKVGTKERRFLEMRLPIVDCRPNLDSQAAAPFTRDQMRRYVDQFVNGELAPLPETPKHR